MFTSFLGKDLSIVITIFSFLSSPPPLCCAESLVNVFKISTFEMVSFQLFCGCNCASWQNSFGWNCCFCKSLFFIRVTVNRQKTIFKIFRLEHVSDSLNNYCENKWFHLSLLVSSDLWELSLFFLLVFMLSSFFPISDVENNRKPKIYPSKGLIRHIILFPLTSSTKFWIPNLIRIFIDNKYLTTSFKGSLPLYRLQTGVAVWQNIMILMNRV